jgi:hypothetical protein
MWVMLPILVLADDGDGMTAIKMTRPATTPVMERPPAKAGWMMLEAIDTRLMQ